MFLSLEKVQFLMNEITMEAEFIVLKKTCFKVKWLKNLLTDISLWMRPTPYVLIRYDSHQYDVIDKL